MRTQPDRRTCLRWIQTVCLGLIVLGAGAISAQAEGDDLELILIDNFRFAKRMPSRAAAIRELFKRGLAAEGFAAAPNGVRSKDFGVDGKTPRPHR